MCLLMSVLITLELLNSLSNSLLLAQTLAQTGSKPTSPNGTSLSTLRNHGSWRSAPTCFFVEKSGWIYEGPVTRFMMGMGIRMIPPIDTGYSWVETNSTRKIPFIPVPAQDYLQKIFCSQVSEMLINVWKFDGTVLLYVTWYWYHSLILVDA